MAEISYARFHYLVKVRFHSEIDLTSFVASIPIFFISSCVALTAVTTSFSETIFLTAFLKAKVSQHSILLL